MRQLNKLEEDFLRKFDKAWERETDNAEKFDYFGRGVRIGDLRYQDNSDESKTWNDTSGGKTEKSYCSGDYVAIPNLFWSHRWVDMVNHQIDYERKRTAADEFPESQAAGVVWRQDEQCWYVSRFYEGETYFIGRFLDRQEAEDAVSKWNRAFSKCGFGVL
jgi:hypothetical protein